MGKLVIHFRVREIDSWKDWSPTVGVTVWEVACGYKYPGCSTSVPSEVSCKRCKRKMEVSCG